VQLPLGEAMDLAVLRREAETPTVAGRAELEGVSQDLCAAFADDPILNWFLRQDARRDQARLAFFRMIVPLEAFRIGEIERPASGGAAAMWIASERLGPNPLSVELQVAATLVGACGLGRFRRVLALRGAMDKHHPMEQPHDYLWFLGVRPEAQGAGIGSRLLRARTARLDAQGRPAFLETATPRNLPLYQGHGFAIVDEYRPVPDGPVIWALWRDPQASS
jgi:ribosomal protein S18 acetylase RimI-like enzyme